MFSDDMSISDHAFDLMNINKLSKFLNDLSFKVYDESGVSKVEETPLSILFSLNFINSNLLKTDAISNIHGDLLFKLRTENVVIALNDYFYKDYFKNFPKNHMELYYQGLSTIINVDYNQLVYIKIHNRKYLLTDFASLVNLYVKYRADIFHNPLNIYENVALSDDFDKRFYNKVIDSFICGVKLRDRYCTYVTFYQKDKDYYIYDFETFNLHDFIPVKFYHELLIQQTDDEREIEEIKILQSLIDGDRFVLKTEPQLRFFLYRFKKVYDKGINYKQRSKK